MQSRRLITTNPTHARRIPDIWCHGFTRYLGRPLTPTERTVISRLEKARRNAPHPIVVIDPPGIDSAPILRAYLDYRLATSPPAATAALYLPERPKHLQRNPRLLTLLPRNPDSIRGKTPAFILLLNTHLYRRFSPTAPNPRHFRQLCSALFPILDRSGFLIIHIQAADIPIGIHTGLDTRITAPPDKPPTSPPGPVVITVISPQALLTLLTQLTQKLTPLTLKSTLLTTQRQQRYAVLRSPKLNRTASAR